MSKLAEFRLAERELQEQLARLEQMQTDASLQREIEFDAKLKALMSEYDVELAQVVAILNPQPVGLETELVGFACSADALPHLHRCRGGLRAGEPSWIVFRDRRVWRPASLQLHVVGRRFRYRCST